MISSYRFSQEYNFQTFLWGSIGAVSALVRRSIGACAALVACLPVLLAVCVIVARSLGLVALCVAGVVAVALIPPVFWLCLAGIAVGAYVTYPKAVRNG